MSRTFVLVHGHWHGAWAWDAVAAELTTRGHRVISPDLPCEDPGNGTAENADVVLAAMDDAPDDAVLVGHSAGGLTIPIVARRRPVSRLVFVAALLPVPGVSVDQQLADEPEIGQDGFSWIDLGDGLLDLTPDVARRHFYQDCSEDAAARAISRLRLQSREPYEEPSPLDAWPDVPSAYVACAKDRTINPDWQVRAAARRLGVEAAIMDTGHSPMLVAPSLLADHLEAMASR